MKMNIVTECVEVCPHCDAENIYKNYDTIKNKYKAICQSCGKEIFLCDECFHSDDNPQMKCDWNCGTCFRGACKTE